MDLHVLANRVMLQHLTDGGLLKGNIDDMMAVIFNYYLSEQLIYLNFSQIVHKLTGQNF